MSRVISRESFDNRLGYAANTRIWHDVAQSHAAAVGFRFGGDMVTLMRRSIAARKEKMMIYGRMWYGIRGEYWSVRFPKKKILEESIVALDDTKKSDAQPSFYWKNWHLESAMLSNFPKEHRESVKTAKLCESAAEFVQHIHNIHAFWDKHRN